MEDSAKYCSTELAAVDESSGGNSAPNGHTRLLLQGQLSRAKQPVL
jgi:hypothetical protein